MDIPVKKRPLLMSDEGSGIIVKGMNNRRVEGSRAIIKRLNICRHIEYRYHNIAGFPEMCKETSQERTF